jgi:hypothetical protein
LCGSDISDVDTSGSTKMTVGYRSKQAVRTKSILSCLINVTSSCIFVTSAGNFLEKFRAFLSQISDGEEVHRQLKINNKIQKKKKSTKMNYWKSEMSLY